MSESREPPWGGYPVYRPRRRIPTAGLIATIAVMVADLMLFWTVAPVANALDVIATWSGGLIQSSLTGNAMRLVALVALWFGVLALRPRDIGLELAGLSIGLRVLVGGWLVIQLSRAIGTVVIGDQLAWSTELQSRGVTWLVGAIIAQVFGTAFVEEVVHRGLFLPQLFIRIRGGGEGQRVARALLLGSAFFAVNHVPMLAERGYGAVMTVGALVALFAAGCFFAAIYLRTGNLFVAMAVHALTNVSGDVVASPLDGRALAFVLGLGCIVWWPRPHGRAIA
jgi:uncharacterized protein